jgi:hypothetical protein
MEVVLAIEMCSSHAQVHTSTVLQFRTSPWHGISLCWFRIFCLHRLTLHLAWSSFLFSKPQHPHPHLAMRARSRGRPLGTTFIPNSDDYLVHSTGTAHLIIMPLIQIQPIFSDRWNVLILSCAGYQDVRISVSFFCRGRAGLPPYGTYQSLNHGFLPCPVTCPPRDTVNDGDRKFLPVAIV